ncbi:16S rRNA (cytosine(1402)-N(4))-methyltransferase RsmH [Candidatus Daviesbacteria bacterium]|nr:16S rRNA (cytosine(1402)-N(4))-methyltransferase RsmH [Candidatus Daviesbacteria bacterium]
MLGKVEKTVKGYHIPVLLEEVLSALFPPGAAVRDAWVLDLTLGDGGHSIEVLMRGGKIIGVDVDPQALERVQNRFKQEGIDTSRYRLLKGNFRDIGRLIEEKKEIIITQTETDLKFRGVVMDLGVSSMQLETPQRGFSFIKDAPLDMRMDPSLQVTAKDLVNGLNKGELNELLSKLGEEKYSRRVADALVSARQIGTQRRIPDSSSSVDDLEIKLGIQTTTELAKVVEDVYRRYGFRYRKGIHPATKVFQALRIAVNDELNALRETLEQILQLIERDGRIAIISYHSLEDRIVKNTFNDWQKFGLGELLNKKPIRPGRDEVVANPRSRSAKMRVFLKT